MLSVTVLLDALYRADEAVTEGVVGRGRVWVGEGQERLVRVVYPFISLVSIPGYRCVAFPGLRYFYPFVFVEDCVSYCSRHV